MPQPDLLEVRVYESTEPFQAISRHTAVTHTDGRLVAVTGPAGDPDSIHYAHLFAQAPQMLDLLDRIHSWFCTVEAHQLPHEPAWYDDLTEIATRIHAALDDVEGVQRKS